MTSISVIHKPPATTILFETCGVETSGSETRGSQGSTLKVTTFRDFRVPPTTTQWQDLKTAIQEGWDNFSFQLKSFEDREGYWQCTWEFATRKKDFVVSYVSFSQEYRQPKKYHTLVEHRIPIETNKAGLLAMCDTMINISPKSNKYCPELSWPYKSFPHFTPGVISGHDAIQISHHTSWYNEEALLQIKTSEKQAVVDSLTKKQYLQTEGWVHTNYKHEEVREGVCSLVYNHRKKELYIFSDCNGNKRITLPFSAIPNLIKAMVELKGE